jgi:hypothetical protein
VSDLQIAPALAGHCESHEEVEGEESDEMDECEGYGEEGLPGEIDAEVDDIEGVSISGDVLPVCGVDIEEASANPAMASPKDLEDVRDLGNGITLVKTEMRQEVKEGQEEADDAGRFFVNHPEGELKKVHFMLLMYAEDADMEAVAEQLDAIIPELNLLVDVQGCSVLVHKPGFEKFSNKLSHPFPVSYKRLDMPRGQGTTKAKEIMRTMLQARMKHQGTRIFNWRLKSCGESGASWTADMLFTEVKDMTKDELDRFVLDAGLKPEYERSELEVALLTKDVRNGVMKLRKNAAERNKFAGVMKYLDDSMWESHAEFPEDFQNLDQKVTFHDGSEMTLEEFVKGPAHLQYALLLLGDRKLGKSPFCKATARFWTLGHLGEHPDGTPVPLSDLCFAYCATVAALNRVTAAGIMKSLMPVIMDDSDLQDGDQNRTGSSGDFQGLRANYVKHMLNVQDGGEMGARFNQTMFKERQPRIFVSNDLNVDGWLPKGYKREHKDAVLKKMAICVLSPDKPLVKESARQVHAQRNQDDTAEMLARIERLKRRR